MFRRFLPPRPRPRLEGGPKPQQRLNPSRVVCHRGEWVPGCQKEFLSTVQLPVTTTPSVVATNNPYRDSVHITNVGPSLLYYGPFGVSAAGPVGKSLSVGESATLPITAEVWAVTLQGSSVIEVSEVPAK